MVTVHPWRRSGYFLSVEVERTRGSVAVTHRGSKFTGNTLGGRIHEASPTLAAAGQKRDDRDKRTLEGAGRAKAPL